MSDAWFGCWRCDCSDVEETPEAIPDRCPTHAAELHHDNAGRTRVQLDREPISGYGVLARGEVRESLR